jgi:colanic acid/amylovoran biosynthesis protein
MKSIQVAILGTPVSSNNRGVLALGASLINLFSENVSGDVKPFLMLDRNSNKPVPFRISGRTQYIRVINCRLSPRSRICDHLGWIVFSSLLYRYLPLPVVRRTICRFTPWIDELEKADLVGDVRGGDSFSDIYGMGRFIHGFLMAWTVVLLKRKFVQLPQTYGPYKNAVARQLARYLLKKSSVVIARDKNSQRIAQELMGPGKEVWVSPDVAFSLESIKPKKIEIYPPQNGNKIDVIGLNVNGLMANGGYNRNNMFGLKLDYRLFLIELVKQLMAVHDGEIWLIPHTYGPADSIESDPEACRHLRKALPSEIQKRARIVTGEYDQHQIKNVIGQCDFFIGSRMHACIAALSQGIPCVGVAYSQKFEGVFESVGMADWVVDGRKLNNEQGIYKILELFRGRDAVRQTLTSNSYNAQLCLKSVFERLISGVANETLLKLKNTCSATEEK